VLEKWLDSSGYLNFLRMQGTDESTDRVENLAELVSAMDEYVEGTENPTIAGFLEEVALAADVDAQADADAELGQVTLMTLHSAKGLEFPTVYIPGMEEGIFPHSRSLDDPGALEEERRLCYVGLTRGEDRVFLSGARVRTVFGQSRWSDISRFISEIPDDLLDLGKPASSRRGLDVDQSYPEFDDLEVHASEGVEEPVIGGGLFSPGMAVQHATFGEGEVISSDGAGKGEKLTVQFPGVGRKVIVARFVERV
jgi:DNA helicase-2/ATP-dependent DNA helicase PcrA